MTARRPAPSAPQALRRSLDAKLREAARAQRVSIPQVRKQYVFALFFRRLFAQDSTTYLLLGGNALLIRTGGGRYTDDIDLARNGHEASPTTILDELRSLPVDPVGDSFRFHFDEAHERDHRDDLGYGARSVRVSARALLGGRLFEPFTLDITTKRHIDHPVENHPVRRIIDHPSLYGLPEIPLVPIENHLADKICAMYERHRNESSSTRYRDLADIIRIIDATSFRSDRLMPLLRHEAQRRRLQLPQEISAPGPEWHERYPVAAAGFAGFPPRFHELDASLAHAERCLGPILRGELTPSTWNPTEQAWE